MLGVRSFLTAFRAGRRFRRAQEFERAGRSVEALGVAREGLSILHSSQLIRTRPSESAVLVMLTVTVERLASQLGQQGAAEADLRAVLQILESYPGRAGRTAELNTEWIAMLRAHLENR